jgi:hypothetical protein
VPLTIVVAQSVMVLASLVAMRVAEDRYWGCILITFIAMPIRGLGAASVIEGWGVSPVQILDAVGAGLQSVAVPGLVARVLNGAGWVNVGQGAVMTVQGVGAALSPALGAAIVQLVGVRIAVVILGSFALGSLALWLAYSASMQSACPATRTEPVAA